MNPSYMGNRQPAAGIQSLRCFCSRLLWALPGFACTVYRAHAPVLMSAGDASNWQRPCMQGILIRFKYFWKMCDCGIERGICRCAIFIGIEGGIYHAAVAQSFMDHHLGFHSKNIVHSYKLVGAEPTMSAYKDASSTVQDTARKRKGFGVPALVRHLKEMRGSYAVNVTVQVSQQFRPANGTTRATFEHLHPYQIRMVWVDSIHKGIYARVRSPSIVMNTRLCGIFLQLTPFPLSRIRHETRWSRFRSSAVVGMQTMLMAACKSRFRRCRLSFKHFIRTQQYRKQQILFVYRVDAQFAPVSLDCGQVFLEVRRSASCFERCTRAGPVQRPRFDAVLRFRARCRTLRSWASSG